MKRLLRWCIHRLLGDYALYRIYTVELVDVPEPEADGCELRSLETIDELTRAGDPAIRALAQYSAGSEAFGFVARVAGEPAAACWIWAGETYRRRNFWPLQADEAKLVQITTGEKFRGRGLAPALIAFAACRLRDRGYHRLFARIWHSNTPSIRAFEKAGWQYVAFVAELFPFGSKRPIRLVRNKFKPSNAGRS